MEMQIIDLKRKNFGFNEFFESATIKNHIQEFYKLSPEEQQSLLENGMLLADKIQEIRDFINMPIDISSGWRSKLLNRMVKGATKSQHLVFEAVDWRPVVNNEKVRDSKILTDIVLKLKEKNIVVDQCLVEETWIHTSIKQEGNRNQFATYFKGANGKRRLIEI